MLKKLRCDLSHDGKVTQQEVFVVDGLKNNLMGLPGITALNLAVRLDSGPHSEHIQGEIY